MQALQNYFTELPCQCRDLIHVLSLKGGLGDLFQVGSIFDCLIYVFHGLVAVAALDADTTEGNVLGVCGGGLADVIFQFFEWLCVFRFQIFHRNDLQVAPERIQMEFQVFTQFLFFFVHVVKPPFYYGLCVTASAGAMFCGLLANLFQQSVCHIGHRLPVSLTVGAAVFQLVGDPLRQIGRTQ